MNLNNCYNNNEFLKKAGVVMKITPDEVKEYMRCMNDIVYFAENYVKVMSLDEGMVLFKPYPYQKKFIKKLKSKRQVISLQPRQMGKTITVAVFLLHQLIFNKDYTVAILANKGDQAQEIMYRIQMAYESLPWFLQPGVRVWNKRRIELGNNSVAFTSATSSSAIRGRSVNCVFVDEIGFVENAEDFFASTYPVISSGKNTKFIVTSTPNGMNFFYKLWKEAEEGKNAFYPLRVKWQEHPKRDKAWYKQMEKSLSPKKLAQEVNCLHGEETVTIRKKNTGETETMQIRKAYKLIPFNRNIRAREVPYEILGPHGYREFAGFRRSYAQSLAIIYHECGAKVATPDHKFVLNGKTVLARAIKRGDVFFGYVVKDVRVVNFPKGNGVPVFDPIDVSGGNLYMSGNTVNHNCEFLGSSDTLISGSKLGELTYSVPKTYEGHLEEYEAPKESASYVLCADTSEGVGIDYSVATVIDVTQVPYKVVAMWRDNETPPQVFSQIVFNLATKYNEAVVVVEANNSSGGIVCDYLWNQLEYENMVLSKVKNGDNNIGFSKTMPGVRTTRRTKSLGCNTLKGLIETDMVILNAETIVTELLNFVLKGNSYQADKGFTDDAVMTLVLFGWFTTQEFFSDMTNKNVKMAIKERLESAQSDYLLDMYITDGTEDFE